MFCYCKLNMDDEKNLELQSFYIKNGWALFEEITQIRIEEPDPEAGFVMAYIQPGPNSLSDAKPYSAEEGVVPDWELNLKPTRYIPNN